MPIITQLRPGNIRQIHTRSGADDLSAFNDLDHEMRVDDMGEVWQYIYIYIYIFNSRAEHGAILATTTVGLAILSSPGREALAYVFVFASTVLQISPTI